MAARLRASQRLCFIFELCAESHKLCKKSLLAVTRFPNLTKAPETQHIYRNYWLPWPLHTPVASGDCCAFKKAVKRLKSFTNIINSCLLSSLCNVLPPFVPKCPQMMNFFNNKLKKNRLKHFGALTAKKFDEILKLKEKLQFLPKFALSNTREKYSPESNVANMQIVCVLLQEQLKDTSESVRNWSWLLAEAD